MESESELPTNTCAVCGSSAKSACSGCKNIFYCSQAHQKQDWKIHRENCTPYKINVEVQPEIEKTGFSSSSREHLTASRDLRAGIIVLEEAASFYSPVWFFPLVGEKQLNFDNDLDQLCVACGKLLKTQTLTNGELLKGEGTDNYHCSKCSWPLCSKLCEKNEQHAHNECKFFIEHKITFPPSKPTEEEVKDVEGAKKMETAIRLQFTHTIAMLRGLGFKRQNPQLFNKLKNLQQEQSTFSFVDAELRSILIDNIFQLKVLTLQKSHKDATVDQLMAMPLENEEDYVTAFQLIQSNQFMLSKCDHMWGDPQPKSATYIYPDKVSLISHSCIPNCSWTIGPPPEYKIRIRTTVLIKKGDRLCISRVLIPRLQYDSTINRQLSLKKCGISCHCERCVDPTELGLFSSATACPKCKEKKKISPTKNLGYLLPENPFLPDKSTFKIWKCNNNHDKGYSCDFTMEGSEHEKMMSEIIQKIQEMNVELQSDEKDLGFLSGVDIYRYWDEMGNRSEKLGESVGLHPNHTLLHYLIKTSVLNQFNIKQVPYSMPEIIQRRKDRLLYCLKIEDKICPGLSVERARVSATLLKLLYSVLISSEWTQNLTKEEIRRCFDVFKKCSIDAYKFYRNEFHQPGEQMNVEAEMIPKVVNLVEAMNLPWLQEALNEKIVITI